MKPENLRSVWLPALAVLAFAVTFALNLWPLLSTQTALPAGEAAPDSSLLRGAARAVLIGRAENTAQLAARWGRRDAYLRALKELRSAGAAEAAVTLAGEVAVGPAERAVQAAMLRGQLPGAAETDGMSGRAAELYQRALRLDPDFASADPMKLNALGYFLADRGRTRQEFQTAEHLTRRAVRLWSTVLDQMEPDNPRRLIYEYYRAQLGRDSLAWALFKQGRYDEAEREQEEAVTTARRVAARAGLPVQADLYYHLGEIYRKQGRFEAARRQYRAALETDSDHEPSLRALEELGDAPDEGVPGGSDPQQPAPDESTPDGDAPGGEFPAPPDPSPPGQSPLDQSPLLPARFETSSR
jgi:tetratricopeptide (TPR) repeat protein